MKGKGDLGNMGVDGGMTLKMIIQDYVVKVDAGFTGSE
jgi:hypothetical protein